MAGCPEPVACAACSGIVFPSWKVCASQSLPQCDPDRISLPGCGMTRAMLSILRGDFASAWRFHPFSYVLLMWAAAFGIRRYILQKDVKILMKCLIVILIGMLVFYVYRMVRYFPGEPPMSYDESSRLYRLYRLWKGNV